MEVYGLIPWQKLESGRSILSRARGDGLMPVMLRIRVQLFYNLSDPGMEDLLYGPNRSGVSSA